MKTTRNGLDLVAYATVTTPLGESLVAASTRGVCFHSLGGTGAKRRLEQWVARHEPGARLVHDPRTLAPVLRQVREYWAGKRQEFELALDPRGSEFQLAVWRAEARIPFGQTRTYAEIARAIGRARASRAVGGATGRNPLPLFVPCHRVLATGGIGGFTGGLEKKRALLAREGLAGEFAD